MIHENCSKVRSGLDCMYISSYFLHVETTWLVLLLNLIGLPAYTQTVHSLCLLQGRRVGVAGKLVKNRVLTRVMVYMYKDVRRSLACE